MALTIDEFVDVVNQLLVDFATLKDIPGYEGRYSITEDAIIFSYLTNKVMAIHIGKKGYPKVSLYKDGKKKTYEVHALVALTFMGERPPGCDTMHLDDNRGNPKLSNLRYGSKSCNMAFKVDNGTQYLPQVGYVK